MRAGRGEAGGALDHADSARMTGRDWAPAGRAGPAARREGTGLGTLPPPPGQPAARNSSVHCARRP